MSPYINATGFLSFSRSAWNFAVDTCCQDCVSSTKDTTDEPLCLHLKGKGLAFYVIDMLFGIWGSTWLKWPALGKFRIFFGGGDQFLSCECWILWIVIFPFFLVTSKLWTTSIYYTAFIFLYFLALFLFLFLHLFHVCFIKLYFCKFSQMCFQYDVGEK